MYSKTIEELLVRERCKKKNGRGYDKALIYYADELIKTTDEKRIEEIIAALFFVALTRGEVLSNIEEQVISKVIDSVEFQFDELERSTIERYFP